MRVQKLKFSPFLKYDQNGNLEREREFYSPAEKKYINPQKNDSECPLTFS